jgi:hypothetical protein
MSRKKDMSAMLRFESPAARHLSNSSLARGVVVGFIGGLVGTLVMDLFGFGLFVIMGGHASLSFSIIGDAAAGFLSILGVTMAGGAPLGAILHYGIGLVLGVILVAAASRISALRLDSTKKGIRVGILYVEAMSLPMLSAAAIVLEMTASQSLQWFGVSFVMHLVYGAVLGFIVSYGLRSAIR